MNLSFAGCGFLGIYHVGVAVAFKQYAPHLLLEKIGGASAGALAATCLLCDMPLGELTSDFFRVVNEARSHKLKAFSPSFNIQNCLLEGLEKFLPVNAHELVNGKLHISLTRFWGRKNVIVSHFDSREELLQALLCACWIPVFSGYVPPKFRGVSYMDGAFSDNLPVLDENTITVSPFCGESDICPRDDSAQLFHVNLANTSIEVSLENMGRLRRILVPCLPEELSDMCQQGFDDALQFLHRNDLISCTRCLAVQSTFVVQERIHDPRTKKHFDPKCVECVRHRMEALDGNKMPETVLTVFQTYIENANIGLAKWIFRNRGWRLLETLSLPATVPADMICATLTKILLMTNNIVSIVGDSMERRQMEMWVLTNYINQSQPVMPLHAHRHRYLDTDADADASMQMPARLDWLFQNWSRLLATTPCLRERFWHLADFLIDQINALNSIVQTQRTQKMSANISCQLSLTECGQQKVKTLTHRSSKLDILINDNEIVSTIDRQLPQHLSGNSNAAVTSPLVSSTTFPDNHHHHHHHQHHHHQQQQSNNQHAHGDVDSFDHILQTTSHHEAVYAYYYMDENHKVKVTEIFDMTDNEDTDLQTITERVLNQQLQFDASEWDARPTADYLPGESALGGGHGHLDDGSRSHQQHHHHHHHAQPKQHEPQPVSANSSSSSNSIIRRSSTIGSDNHNNHSSNHRRSAAGHNNAADDDDDSNDAMSERSAAIAAANAHSYLQQQSTPNYYTDLMEEDDIDGFLFRPLPSESPSQRLWSSDAENDMDDDDDDDEMSIRNNCSDPEVDQPTGIGAGTLVAKKQPTAAGKVHPEAVGMQISEQATQALSRASQLHLHLF